MRTRAGDEAQPRSARRGGFTLIEVLAAVTLTSVVMLAAVTLYIQISDASQHAQESTRDGRVATALLDRVARDLQGAYLIERPEDVLDPLEHPWFFIAEPDQSGEGADRLAFVSTTQRPGAREHSTDIATIAYSLTPSAGEAIGTFDLLRATVPGRPADANPEFPHPDDPNVVTLAEDLVDFSMRFVGEDGEWIDRWNSTLILHSSRLPHLVEIRVALLDERAPLDELGFLEAEPLVYTRSVALPLRPIPQAVFEATGFGAASSEIDDDNPNGCQPMSFGQCLMLQAPECLEAIQTANAAARESAGTRMASASCVIPRTGMPSCFDPGLCR